MKFGMRLDALRYELRVTGRVLWVVPLVLVLAFAAFGELMFLGNVNHDFIGLALVAGLEAVLPFALAMSLATLAVQDPSLELLLSLRMPYRWIAFRRFLLIIVWTLFVELLATLALYLILPWVPQKPWLVGQLTWLAPSLWLAGIGVLSALLLRSRATCGAFLGVLWIIELAFHGYLAAQSWSQPMYLFATLYTPGAAYWLLNRVVLVATALVFFGCAWLYLRSPERRFYGEEA